MHDRRKHPRHAFPLTAWCEAERWTVRAPIVDVSEEGLRVRSCLREPSGTRVRVSFDDGVGGEVVAVAEVVWCADGRKPATGLRVVELLHGAETFRDLLRAAG